MHDDLDHDGGSDHDRDHDLDHHQHDHHDWGSDHDRDDHDDHHHHHHNNHDRRTWPMLRSELWRGRMCWVHMVSRVARLLRTGCILLRVRVHATDTAYNKPRLLVDRVLCSFVNLSAAVPRIDP
jgi:hypothetical protein